MHTIPYIKRFFTAMTCIAVLVVSVMPPLQAGQQTRFFSDMPDVPLMTGLQELPSESIGFDKPEGRIIEVTADIGSRSPQNVLAYYKAVLPHLGWHDAGGHAYYRDQEVLRLFIESVEGVTYLKVSVAPRP